MSSLICGQYLRRHIKSKIACSTLLSFCIIVKKSRVHLPFLTDLAYCCVMNSRISMISTMRRIRKSRCALAQIVTIKLVISQFYCKNRPSFSFSISWKPGRLSAVISCAQVFFRRCLNLCCRTMSSHALRNREEKRHDVHVVIYDIYRATKRSSPSYPRKPALNRGLLFERREIFLRETFRGRNAS